MTDPIPSFSALFSQRYLALCDRIQPGDIIAFSGLDLPSTVVKVATQSGYVHVAIVFSVERTVDGAEDSPSPAILIAESHIDTSLPSVGTGKHTLGVQLQWLRNRLACAQGSVWWAPLRTPLTVEQIQTLQTWLWEVESKEVSYDFVQAVGAGFDTCDRFGLENTPDESAFFCSELVTYALQKVGVVSPQINPSEQTPADLMAFSCFQPSVLIQETS